MLFLYITHNILYIYAGLLERCMQWACMQKNVTWSFPHRHDHHQSTYSHLHFISFCNNSIIISDHSKKISFQKNAVFTEYGKVEGIFMYEGFGLGRLVVAAVKPPLLLLPDHHHQKKKRNGSNGKSPAKTKQQCITSWRAFQVCSWRFLYVH